MTSLRFIAIIGFLVIYSALIAQSKVDESCKITSTILNSEMNYSVYLPDGYDTSNRDYPVLYLLHGYGDDHTGWIQRGEVQSIADNTIKEGFCSPMIIIMPDASKNRIGYHNDVKGDYNFENYIFEELIPHVEKKYRIRSQKTFRAIAGLSMGGGGTLVYALRHPDMFSSACPLSPVVLKDWHIKKAKDRLQQLGLKATDKDIEKWAEQYDVIKLVNEMPVEKRYAVRFYIDCGDDDFLFEDSSLLHIAMRKNNIPHEFRIRDGVHNWVYWRAALPNVLNFISQSFR